MASHWKFLFLHGKKHMEYPIHGWSGEWPPCQSAVKINFLTFNSSMSGVLEPKPKVTFAILKQKMSQWNGSHLKFCDEQCQVERDTLLFFQQCSLLPSLSDKLLMLLPGLGSMYLFSINYLVLLSLFSHCISQVKSELLIMALTKV